MALLVRWLLLCAGKLCENAPEVTAMALREQVRVCAAAQQPLHYCARLLHCIALLYL